MTAFKKITAAALAALTLGTLAATPASAGGWNHHWNAPLAGGIIGGLALGAVLNSSYAAEPQGDIYECHRVRQPIYNEYGDIVAFRKVRVCD